jgi:hypothetical protein
MAIAYTRVYDRTQLLANAMDIISAPDDDADQSI